MSDYLNLTPHAVVLPSGQPLAPGGHAELEEEQAQALVRAGVLYAVPAKGQAKTKKGGSS